MKRLPLTKDEIIRVAKNNLNGFKHIKNIKICKFRFSITKNGTTKHVPPDVIQ